MSLFYHLERFPAPHKVRMSLYQYSVYKTHNSGHLPPFVVITMPSRLEILWEQDSGQKKFVRPRASAHL